MEVLQYKVITPFAYFAQDKAPRIPTIVLHCKNISGGLEREL